jgi:hypothetical protein
MKTAIEWLEEKLKESLGEDFDPVRGYFVMAKEMEKEQIREAFITEIEIDDNDNNTIIKYQTAEIIKVLEKISSEIKSIETNYNEQTYGK